MTNKIYQLFEYAYIGMFLFSIYMVIANWTTNKDQAYLFGFFGVVAIFMFFFKRRFRKKLEQRKEDK